MISYRFALWPSQKEPAPALMMMSGIGQHLGHPDQFHSRSKGLPLGLEFSKLFDFLWCQSDKAVNRNTRFRDGVGCFTDKCAALDFHRINTGLFHQPTSVSDHIRDSGLIGHRRYIARPQNCAWCLSDRFAVINHLIHGYRQGVGVAEDTHPTESPNSIMSTLARSAMQVMG